MPESQILATPVTILDARNRRTSRLAVATAGVLAMSADARREGDTTLLNQLETRIPTNEDSNGRLLAVRDMHVPSFSLH